jgi:hypothetical protein
MMGAMTAGNLARNSMNHSSSPTRQEIQRRKDDAKIQMARNQKLSTIVHKAQDFDIQQLPLLLDNLHSLSVNNNQSRMYPLYKKILTILIKNIEQMEKTNPTLDQYLKNKLSQIKTTASNNVKRTPGFFQIAKTSLAVVTIVVLEKFLNTLQIINLLHRPAFKMGKILNV